jgi:hypothetical protein
MGKECLVPPGNSLSIQFIEIIILKSKTFQFSDISCLNLISYKMLHRISF